MDMRLILPTLALLLAACDPKEEEAPAATPGDLVPKLTALADEGCACTDKACGDAVLGKLDALAAGVTDVADSDLEALQAIQGRLDHCLAKLNPIMVAYAELADAICACKDAKCGKKVSKKFDAWSADLKKRGKGALHQTDVRVAQELGGRAAVCFETLGLPVPK
jgi:hypothetical protein